MTALGSSREDQRLLEDSVKGIIAENSHRSPDATTQSQIGELTRELESLEREFASVERRLREMRESELHSHELSGGYRGTAAQLARRLQDEHESLGWFPKPLNGEPTYPHQTMSKPC